MLDVQQTTEADESWLHDLFDDAINDDWAGYGDTVQQKYAALAGKAYNPDEPRVQSGPEHGEWTSASSWKPSMTREEADAWATGPYGDQAFVHSTSPEAAQAIPHEGFRPGTDAAPHVYGRGIYVAAASSNRSGMGANLTVRVSGKKFFDYYGPGMFAENGHDPGPLPASPEFKALEAKYEAAGVKYAFGSALTDYLQAHGYDGISYNDRGHGYNPEALVIFDPHNITVAPGNHAKDPRKPTGEW